MTRYADLTPYVQLITDATKGIGSYHVAAFHSMVFETGIMFVHELIPDLFGDKHGRLALEIRVVEGRVYDIASMDEPFDKVAKGVAAALKGNDLVSPHLTVYYT